MILGFEKRKLQFYVGNVYSLVAVAQLLRTTLLLFLRPTLNPIVAAFVGINKKKAGMGVVQLGPHWGLPQYQLQKKNREIKKKVCKKTRLKSLYRKHHNALGS